MEAILTGLLLFAAAHTDLPVPAEPPEVRQVSQSELNALAPSVAARLPDGRSLAGTYRDGVVYLRDDFDIRSGIAHSVLLHELVHYMQDAEGLLEKSATSCPSRDIEAPAYVTQAALLERIGIPPAVINLTPERLAAMAEAC